MSKGQELFQWVCKQPDTLAAVTSLSLADFRKLGGWLARRGEINGIPGKVWQMCLVDAFRRLVGGKAASAEEERKKVNQALG